jgi:pseudouridine synthase
MDKIRIGTYLAKAGVCSRRKAGDLIGAGKVEVNGKTVTEFNLQVSDEDQIKVEGKDVRLETKEYWIVNKPLGVVSTADDEQGRETVISLVNARTRVFPVGRLDMDSRGLMILTNDGELAYRLTHPKFEVEKEYIVKILGTVTEERIAKLKSGVELEEGVAKARDIKVIKQNRDITILAFVLTEGKKREVRRMCEEVEWKIINLKRVRFATVSLGELKDGESRRLTSDEISGLRKVVGMNSNS